jgi:hypothetical protein
MQSPAAYPQPQNLPANPATAFLARMFASLPEARREAARGPDALRTGEEVDLAERVRMTGEW